MRFWDPKHRPITARPEPDPTKQKIAFVLLAIQQSTEVVVRVARGKQLTRVTVIDRPLNHWALREVYALAGAA